MLSLKVSFHNNNNDNDDGNGHVNEDEDKDDDDDDDGVAVGDGDGDDDDDDKNKTYPGLRIPRSQRQTSWLFTSMAEELDSGLQQIAAKSKID